MGLRFILGRSGTGKSSLCIEEIAKKQSQNKDHNLIFIVPEQFSLQAERDLISKTSGRGIMKAQVLSFRRLAFNIFAQRGEKGKETLKDIGKVMALRKIINDNSSKLNFFRKSIDKQGFMEQLSLTITEFFQYNVTVEKLEQLYNSAEDGSIVKNKLGDLLIIYKGYIDFFKESYITPDDALDLLYEKLDEKTFISKSEIWLDGFYGFTPQEYKVIEKLLIYAENVTFTFTIDENTYKKENVYMTSPFFEPWDTIRRLKKSARENNVILKEHLILKKPLRFNTYEMKSFEKEFFSYNPIPCVKSDNIKFFSASSKYSEIYYVARKIRELAQEGYRYADIAIVTNDVSGYEKIINGIFNEFEIPCFIDIKREILSSPIIEFIRSMVDIIVHNFSYDSVFRFLKTNLTTMGNSDIDILENYVLAYGIKNYKWFVPEWKYGFENDEDEQKYKINNIKNIFIEFMQPLYENIKKDKKYLCSEITIKVFEIIQNLKVAEKVSAWIQTEEDNGNYLASYEYKQCWSVMIGVFERFNQILGQTKLTIDEYAKILDAGFQESDMGIIPTGVDNIIVGDIERTRLPDIKVLFVLGVNEGILPSAAETDGIFSDMERNIIEEMGTELAHNAKRKAFEENFLIYSGLTKGKEKLFISYCSGDLRGKSMRPSVLIGKIKKIFVNSVLEEETRIDNMELISAPIPTLHILGQKLRILNEGGEIDEVWKDTFSIFMQNENWNKKMQNILKALTDKNTEEYLKKEIIKKIYPNEIRSSISRLEKFSECPFSYFLQYGVKAKERQLYSIKPPDLGSLFHKVLEEFSFYLRENNINWREIEQKQMNEIIDKIVDKIAPELGNEILLSTSAYKYIIRRLKRISKRAVYALTIHIKKGSFEPFDFEVGFGENESLPPIVIELSDGKKLMLNGKIDRVDIFENDGQKYVKVIDYKSGKKQFSLQDIYYGMQLQLMLYMDAFIKGGKDISENALFPAGVFYFKINDPMITGSKELDNDEIEDLLLNKLKMSGLVLKNNDVIHGLDNEFKKKSKIIPVSLNNDGSYSSSSSIAEIDEYSAVMKFAEEKARNSADEIVKGNISISPYKNKKVVSCTYCKYKTICRFDPSAKENKYRDIKSINKDEVMEKIKNEIEESGKV